MIKTFRFFLKFLLVFSFFVSLSISLFSQIKKIGVPLVVNYEKGSFEGGRQTWDIAQQSNGLLYFANNAGVLQFDGSFWQTFSMPNNSVVHSVAVDSLDNIYCGGSSEFGLFKPNEYGVLQYISLSDSLPDKLRQFDEVWKIYSTKDGVYFQTYTSLFLYTNNQLLTLFHGKELGFSFYANDTLFVRNVYENKFLAFKSTLQFEKKINNWNTAERLWGVESLDSKKYLILSNEQVYVLEGRNLSQWNASFNEILKRDRVFSIVKINASIFAFGTVLNGIYVVNTKGEILQHISREKGLQNNTVLSLFLDNSEKLWLGLDNGISEIEINSPFTFFNEGVNLKGTGYASQIFEGDLYLGTNQGVQYSKWNGKDNKFKILDALKGQTWAFSKIDNELFCCHNDGIFEIDSNQTIRSVSKVPGSWNLKKIPNHPNLLLSGVYDGLILLEKEADGIWNYSHRIANFNISSRFIEFENDTTFWISHGFKGVYSVVVNNDFSRVENVKFYDNSKGLPSNYGNTLFKLKGKIAVSTIKGVYIFDKKKDKFIKSISFDNFFFHLNAFFPQEDSSGNIWFTHDRQFSYLKKTKEGDYNLVDSLFNRFKNTLVAGFEFIYPYDKNNVIIGVEDGFLHFNPKMKIPKPHNFSAYIRKVIVQNSFDTLEFDLSQQNSYLLLNSFDYKGNSLKFMFSAPFYQNKNSVQYRFYLENFDSEWSDWDLVQQKEYTNLEPGKYVFRVKAKNIYGVESDETVFQFTVLPPWYQTIYAVIFYFVLAVILVYLIANNIVKRVEQDKVKFKNKQKEALRSKEKAFEAQNAEAEREIIKLKNEKLNADIKTKSIQFDLKKKELASIAMQITHKNEILSQIKDSLSDIYGKVNAEAQKHLKKMIRSIESETKVDEDWNQFKKHFEQVHGDFFKQLKKDHPELTPKDLKLCAYLRINLSTKEIAPLMNISVRGVEISRYRLRKKLGLVSNENLIDYMMEV